MNRSALIWEALKSQRLVGLLAPDSPEDCVRAYEALHPAGVVLEIALRTPAALEGMSTLRRQHPEALFLAGTVMTPRQAEQAIGAGAGGVVSPDYLPAVVEACAKQDVMCIPGGLGDVGKQLAQKAALYGCEPEELRVRHPYQWVHKLFPAMAAAPASLEMVQPWKAVYPGLTVVYTGGVTADNVAQIVRRDPEAIVCGSALTRHVTDAEQTATEVRRWRFAMQGRAIEDERPARREAARPRPPGSAAAVVTFGEVMLRLSAPYGMRFGQVGRFEATFGGAEANVAVALAKWGLESRFVTALPEHAIGQAAVDALRSHGVDTRHVLRQGSRIGIYYLEHGASQRPSQVIYDRSGSSAAKIQAGQIDWAAVLQGADWFHCTGITPALSASVREALAQALQAARQIGVTVSLDLNYRAKLWPKDRAREVLAPMMEYVDIVISNEEDAGNVFGIGPNASEVASGKLDAEAYRDAARELVSRFGLRAAAITLRESRSASKNVWSACLDDGREFHHSASYPIRIVDRVGAGDAFAAGLIYGLLAGKSNHEALEFATAASCWKHTVWGDFNLATVAEVESLASGNVSGRVQR